MAHADKALVVERRAIVMFAAPTCRTDFADASKHLKALRPPSPRMEPIAGQTIRRDCG